MSSPCSPAAPPLDDDDILAEILAEILLRLPPQPSSLPHASAVCKRWRLLVSDPCFLRRFRIHHRRNPPLLGYFSGDLSFVPTMEAPNRVPPGRFSFQQYPRGRFLSLGCRHGLVLLADRMLKQFVVWDPLTGDRHQVALPPGFDPKTTEINGAVLRAAAGGAHFQVVFVGSSYTQDHACVYSSETGVWGDLVSTPIPSEPGSEPDFFLMLFGTRISTEPAVMVGGSLYWIFHSSSASNSILEFDFQKRSLAVVEVDVFEDVRNFMVIRADGGGLGFLFVSDFTAQLWNRKTDCDGVASWVLGRTIELDRLFSLNSEVKDEIRILGYVEENNTVFLWALAGVYEVQLQTLQFKLLRTDIQVDITSRYHPFERVYTAEADIGGEHDGTELLHNA